MANIKNFFIIFILLLNSCSGNPEKVESIIEEDNLDRQMMSAYRQGLDALKKGDVYFAAKKFNEAELLYPQSIWAPRAALMASYSYFSYLYYSDAVLELEKFLDKYKNHPRRDYAYYLLALSHYDQIIDETKDTNEILKALENKDVSLHTKIFCRVKNFNGDFSKVETILAPNLMLRGSIKIWLFLYAIVLPVLFSILFISINFSKSIIPTTYS